MKIGIASDSHGKTRRLAAALQALRERGAETIVHCGDVGSADCLRALAECGAQVYVVAGNMDRHVDDLADVARELGLHFDPESLDVPAGGKRLAVTHGHFAILLNRLIADGKHAFVCHGHTHVARDDRVGAARVINPGALHHPKGPRHPTVALLDTETDVLEQIPVR